MRKGISEIIGSVTFSDGSPGVAYRALRQILCASCGKVIAEGTLFTRHPLPGQSLPISPLCRDCAPFELDQTAQEETRSPLLDSLLSSQQTTTDKTSQPKRADDIAGAVEQRLGPALTRARRKLR